MLDDQQLLRCYTADGSEAAFGELVARYVNLVYSAALRRTGGDTHFAQDVAQLVFTDLARKGRSLPDGVVLAGWLHRATHYAAAQLLRTERRRVAREQEAVAMNTLESEPNPDWEQIRPLLDEALDWLDPADRDAVLLRYFEHKSAKEIGQTLGTSEDAAQKRVSRAVERLREFFAKQGVTVGASGLVAAVSANAVQAAPAGLATTVSIAGALVGASISATTTATATTTVTMAAVLKSIIGVSLAAAVVTPLFVQHRALAKARVEQSMLLAGMQNVAIQTPTTPAIDDTDDQSRRERDDLERLRREIATFRARSSELSTQLQTLDITKTAPKVRGTPIGQTFRLAQTYDAGQATPAALLQTHMWAMLHGDTNRLAQLMALSPETDMQKVQWKFDEMSKETAKGIDAVLEKMPFSEIRLLEEQPADNNDRWVVYEFVNKDGEILTCKRVRVRPANDGWKLVVGRDGGIENETVDEQP